MSHREAWCRYVDDEYKPVMDEVEYLGTQMIRLEWER